jgi:hypothetical protein
MNLRRLIDAGDLVLWHDYRSGHCANLAGVGTTPDAAVQQSQGRFRSGQGFSTSCAEDFEGVADPTSVGYLKVAHDVDLVPPVGGCCVVASYIADKFPNPRSHIIGLGSYGTPAAACWELLRDDRDIRFATSDGAVEDDFQYLIDPNIGGIETVSVRYTGGTGPNNCTIKVHAPAVSSSTGTIDRVPLDVDVALQMCSASGGELQPFSGTLRYVAFIRGAQTQAVLDEVVAELEACNWQTDPLCFDRDGGSATRRLHYVSRFGVDVDYSLAVAKSEISNSGWILTEILDTGVDVSGSVKADFAHHDNAAVWALPDVDKVFRNTWNPGWGDGNTTVHLPTTRMACSTAEAAYGTWDWWMYPVLDPVETNPVVGFWPVSSSPDHLAGYEVRVAADGTLSLQEWAAGVATQLAATAAGIIPMSAWVRFRVTRTAAGAFKVFYDVGAGWVLALSVTDNTVTTSECIVWGGGGGGSWNSMLGLGNHHGDRVVRKWHGVVDPI